MGKRYDTYSKVNTNWVQELPTDWGFLPLQSQLKERKESNANKKTDFILSLTAAKGVIPYSEKKSGGNKAKEDIGKYNISHEGDLLVNCMNVVAGSSGLSNYYGAISPVYYALYPSYEEINRKYYEYLFRNRFFYESLIGLGNGIMMKKSSTGKLNTVRKRIPMNKLKRVMIPVPPKPEQDQIVRYLDWKTSEIDRFVHQEKKQIKKLEEYKFTKIDELITKGMNSHVQMKESGVEWLGQIPEHWDVHTIKQHFKVRKRIAGKEGYDVLSITQQGLKVKDISSNEGQMAMDYSGYQFVNPGDFAMNHMDLITGYVDLSDKFGVTSPDYRVFTLEDTDNCYPEFYLRVFQVAYKRRIFYKFGKGAANQGRWRLPQRAFYNYSIQIPPIEEQKAIEYECKQLEKNIDEMIEALKKEMDLLQELRTKIIADVVTGQIDVRDVVVPDYSCDEDTDSDDIEDDEEEIEESED